MAVQVDFFNPERDRDSVLQMWHEIGWLDQTNARECEAFDYFAQAGPGLVVRFDGAAECLALSTAGRLRYLDADIRLAGITAVTTSPIARQQGLAGRTTAQLVAHCVDQGAQLAMLGIFDQGYYDRLGFGAGSYDHRIHVAPEDLKVALPSQPVCRLGPDDWEAMHDCRVNRTPLHGFVTLDSPMITRGEALWSKNGRGLGFRNAEGRVTHFLWYEADDLEYGPYRACVLCYSDYHQFLDLVGILKSLKDQVKVVAFREPPGIQIQDLIDRPFDNRAKTKGSKYATGIETFAGWQARICDLPGCLAATRLACEPMWFNLKLNDSIELYLDGNDWRGVGGEYIVNLGRESSAEVGQSGDLPTLTASVGAFTRMWLGVQPARGLAATDSLSGPPSLLQSLDHALRLPMPRSDWLF
jgi:hypothetical protein